MLWLRMTSAAVQHVSDGFGANLVAFKAVLDVAHCGFVRFHGVHLVVKTSRKSAASRDRRRNRRLGDAHDGLCRVKAPQPVHVRPQRLDSQPSSAEVADAPVCTSFTTLCR